MAASPDVDIVSIKQGLKDIIVERLKLEITPSSIGDAVPLFGANEGQEGQEGGLALDSVEALEIVVGIEERWGVAIQDDSMASEFYSIDTLSSLVERLLAERPAEAPAAENEHVA
jgi:acyl carrier protein